MKTAIHTNPSEKSGNRFSLQRIAVTAACFLVILILANAAGSRAGETPGINAGVYAAGAADRIGVPLGGLTNLLTHNAGKTDVLFMALGGVAFLLFTEKKEYPAARMSWFE